MSNAKIPSSRRIFVLGGVRSGKSRYAAELAKSLAGDEPVLFVATAEISPDDLSMRERIARHQAERPANWRTTEQPINLDETLSNHASEPVMIVDCLTIWLSNLLARCGDPDVKGFSGVAEEAVLPALEKLCTAIKQAEHHVLLVANDVGSGVAPMTRLGNVFADMQGIVNQRIAATCDEVYLMTAGIERRIK